MSYKGHVKDGVVVFEGPDRPSEGVTVRVEEVAQAANWGEVFKDLIGAAEGLPEDLAENHDHYIHLKRLRRTVRYAPEYRAIQSP
jgi:hypothetical protein